MILAMRDDNSYIRIFKHTSLFGGVQALNILVGIVRNKFAALLLGPAGIGLIAIYNSAVTLLQNATNFGIPSTGVREVAVSFKSGDIVTMERDIRVLRSWTLLVAALGFVATIIAAPLLSLWAFSDGSYTWPFLCLAPVVALGTIAGGEMALLKATRRLASLARASVYSVIAALVVAIPLYYFLGTRGVIPSLLLVAVIQMLFVVIYSWRYHPLRLTFGGELRAGRGMLAIGTAFVIAGICGSGAEFVIRAFLSDMSLSLVGLYNTGYMITMTYAGTMFSAMETDYFPFLSSVCHDVDKMNGAVNRQIEVSLTMLAPCLILLMFAMPIVIPLLFSKQFLPIIGMTQIAVLAMYFRGVNLPVEYIALAKGDSWAYLLIELIYDLLLIVAVICGFSNWGLLGTGVALVVAMLLESVCVVSYYRWRYDLCLSWSVMWFVAVQVVIALMSVACVFVLSGWHYWAVGVLLTMMSTLLSIYKFRRRIR